MEDAYDKIAHWLSIMTDIKTYMIEKKQQIKGEIASFSTLYANLK